jgi:osmotically-inducible protein OsmY
MKMKLLTCIALSAAAGLAACDTKNDNTARPSSATPPARPTQPDNTANNRGDQKPENKTPMDQKENAADIKITAEIRRAIMDDKAMSTNAQNAKIITADGVVTLRGVVASQAEKDAIEAKAKAVAGVTRVDNLLEIKTP